MSDTLNAGVLGFIGGYAGGRADDIDLAEKRDYAEQLRLRTEEAAILKERRLLTLRNNVGNAQNRDQLTTDGLLDAQGNFNTTGLDADLAAMANESNIRELYKTQSGRNTTINKEDRQIRAFGPDTEVFTGEQLDAALTEGPLRTAPRQPSASELRTQLNTVIQTSNELLRAQAPPFGDKQRGILEDVGIGDIATDPEAQSAYASLTMDIAKSSVMADVKEQLRTNPQEFGSMDAGVLVGQVKERQQVVSQHIEGAAKAYQEAMAGLTVTNARERETLARKFIREGIPGPDGNLVDVKGALSRKGFWNPSIQNIMLESMLERR